MKPVVLLVFSINFVLAATYNNGYNCDCVPLLQCSILMSNLQLSWSWSHNSHWLFTDYLKRINCGYILQHPLVCCPESIPQHVFGMTLGNEEISPFQDEKDTKSVKCFIPHPKKFKPPPKIPQIDGIHSSHGHSNGFSSEEVSSGREEKYFTECGRELTNRNYLFGNRTELSDFPWLALLEYKTTEGNQFLCGGVLISNQHVLTSADCATNPQKMINVRLGEYNIKESPDCVSDGNAENTKTCINATVDVAVGEIIVHKKYNNGISNLMEINTSNIAIIKLKEKVKLSYYIQPICLPKHKLKKQKLIVAGWGRSSIPYGKKSDVKLVSKLTQLDPSTCDSDHRLNFFKFPEQICAGISEEHEQPCIADNGGPLMGYEMKRDGSRRVTVFGISIMQSTCDVPGISDVPGVYLNVRSYKHWIMRHMK